MAEHTLVPRPWHVNSLGWHHIEGPRDEHIGVVYDSLADANLIAAAPDLLAALEGFLKESEQPSANSRDTVRVAVAAIAKAKGEPCPTE